MISLDNFILKNVPQNHFNYPIFHKDSQEFYIINENARKFLAHLFDALGNIASYNDYNAFKKRFPLFSKINKSNCSKHLKVKLSSNEGILFYINIDSHLLKIPSEQELEWFMDQYKLKYCPVEIPKIQSTQELFSNLFYVYYGNVYNLYMYFYSYTFVY